MVYSLLLGLFLLRAGGKLTDLVWLFYWISNQGIWLFLRKSWAKAILQNYDHSTIALMVIKVAIKSYRVQGKNIFQFTYHFLLLFFIVSMQEIKACSRSTNTLFRLFGWGSSCNSCHASWVCEMEIIGNFQTNTKVSFFPNTGNISRNFVSLQLLLILGTKYIVICFPFQVMSMGDHKYESLFGGNEHNPFSTESKCDKEDYLYTNATTVSIRCWCEFAITPLTIA